MQKLSLLRMDSSHEREVVYLCSEDIFVEKLKKEPKSGEITKLRGLRPYADENLMKGLYQRVHKVFPSVVFTRSHDGRHFFGNYNGVVLIEVNHLSNEQDVQLVKRIAAQRRCTWMAFQGCDGRSVKILLRYAYPDGALPADELIAKSYHEHVFMDACILYQEILPFPVSIQPSSIYHFFYRSVDKDIYYNPQAEVIPFEMPIEKPDYEFFKQAIQKRIRNNEVNNVSFDERMDMCLLYEYALRKAKEEYHIKKENVDSISLMIHIARTCRDAGIPEEEAVNRTWFHFEADYTKQDLRVLFSNVYKEKQKIIPISILTKSQRNQLQLEEFMNRRYVFRWNTLSDQREYRERLTTCPHFNIVTDSVLKMITQEALREGIDLWDRDVKRYVFSELIPRYNPVESYLFRNGGNIWDGKDYIRSFAKRVPTDDSHWPDKFYRFMLGMVSQWICPQKERAHVATILLIGPQGVHKSTFFKLLLPEELRLGYKDYLDFKNEKDALQSMARYLLINVDEFDRITERQQTLLKFILQETKVNVRLTNDREDSSLPRMASVVGTSNAMQLLTDRSGSRRFICINVKGMIDVDTPINYVQLYAQALYAVMHGERTYFNKDEEVELQKDNRPFYVVDPLEEVFFEYFDRPANEEKGEWLRASEILKELSEKTHLSLVTQSHITELSVMMKHAGFDFHHTNSGNKYRIIRIA